MAAGYRGVILVAAASLVFISIMLASVDENTSSILIFTTILSSAIIILYWKLFNFENELSNDDSASPIRVERNIEKAPTSSISTIKSQVPDPLEQDIDIPLM
ncbi:MAG: hypothetical protein QF479_06645 [Candidatus Poseidoniaceae archaeon]|jgi:hypothetical protein|nr:hypothetical protein [Candidatus Poseidoniaceae archaeon]